MDRVGNPSTGRTTWTHWNWAAIAIGYNYKDTYYGSWWSVLGVELTRVKCALFFRYNDPALPSEVNAASQLTCVECSAYVCGVYGDDEQVIMYLRECSRRTKKQMVTVTHHTVNKSRDADRGPLYPFSSHGHRAPMSSRWQ